MTVLFGGAWQGKHDYLHAQYPNLPPEQLVDNLHLWVQEQLASGNDPVATIRERLDSYDDKVIICNDISCGLVPLTAEERAWREAVGRCMAMLCARAHRVVRLFCGIPTIIKE